MTIIVGRDSENSRLSLFCEGKKYLYGTHGSVPQSVSVSHCQIDFDGNSIKVKNLDIANYTYVNKRAVETKTISRNDKLELGKDHYILEWKAIDEIVPPSADIRPLEKVWNEFDSHRIDQQIADRRFNSLRSATGLITMAAIALSMLTGRQSIWFVALYVFAILASVAFTVKAYRDASSVPQKLQQKSKEFQKEYVCPHCGHFLGNQSYDILAQNDRCPYCKANFIH